MNTNTTPFCSQCNSPLILVSETTETIAGSRFPQTTKTYRCSNETCQSEIDKQTAKRVQMQQERTDADGKRQEKKQQLKLKKEEDSPEIS